MRRKQSAGGRSYGSALAASSGHPLPPPPAHRRPLWVRILLKVAVWIGLSLVGGWLARGGLIRRVLAFLIGGVIARDVARDRP